MYQALYRKWRPKTFADMVGQEHVTQTLVRQVETNRLSHAYLLTGTRGTGKTTCAKVLAKAVNCEHLENGNPCNQCSACIGIDEGSVLDVLELDAASNNGVDQVRALRDEAVYTPGSVKMRVYIIDEVHMLTDQAENALLKILEEPPQHLLFILATTEQHKVMTTIRSRCQQFTFKRIPAQIISQRLSFVAQQEQISLSKEGSDLLARLADGGLRDALSLLDQCSNSDVVDENHILQVLGLAGNLEISSMMESIAKKESEPALLQLNKLYENGRDIGSVLSELSVLARDLLLLKTAPNHGASLLTGGYDQQTLDQLGALLPSPQLLYILSVLQESTGKLVKSSHRRTDGEICLLRLCEPSLEDSTLALSARIAQLESKLSAGIPIAAAPPIVEKPVQPTVAPAMAPPIVEKLIKPIVAPTMAPPIVEKAVQPAVTPTMTPPVVEKQVQPIVAPLIIPQNENDVFSEPPWLDENNVPDGLFASFDKIEEEQPKLAPSFQTNSEIKPVVAPSIPQIPKPTIEQVAISPQQGAIMPNVGSGEFWSLFYPKLQGKIPAPAWPYFIGQPPKVIGRYTPGVLTLWVNQAFTKKRLEIPGCIEGIQAVASEFFGTNVQVLMQIGAPPPETGPVTAVSLTQPVAPPITAPNMAEPLLAQPVMAPPVSEPIMAEPLAQPVMAPPVSEPIMAEPLPQPVMAAPVSEPIMAEPLAQPVMAPPVSDPIMAEPKTEHDPLDELISMENLLNEE